MDKINIINFEKSICTILENVIKYNEKITIYTENGNLIILSEKEYNSLIENI